MILFMASVKLKIGGVTLSAIENYTFSVCLYVSYILMLFYLVAVLRTLKEHKTVIKVFVIYTALEVVKIILGFLTLNAHYTSLFGTGAGTLSTIIAMYLIIQTFNLQNKYVAGPFRIFGASLAPAIIVFFYLTSSSPNTVNANTKNYLDILKILVPLAVLFILQNVDKYIKEQSTIKAGSF